MEVRRIFFLTNRELVHSLLDLTQFTRLFNLSLKRKEQYACHICWKLRWLTVFVPTRNTWCVKCSQPSGEHGSWEGCVGSHANPLHPKSNSCLSLCAAKSPFLAKLNAFLPSSRDNCSLLNSPPPRLPFVVTICGKGFPNEILRREMGSVQNSFVQNIFLENNIMGDLVTPNGSNLTWFYLQDPIVFAQHTWNFPSGKIQHEYMCTVLSKNNCVCYGEEMHPSRPRFHSSRSSFVIHSIFLCISLVISLRLGVFVLLCGRFLDTCYKKITKKNMLIQTFSTLVLSDLWGTHFEGLLAILLATSAVVFSCMSCCVKAGHRKHFLRTLGLYGKCLLT